MTPSETTSFSPEDALTQAQHEVRVPAGNARLQDSRRIQAQPLPPKKDTVLDLRLKSTKSSESTSVEVSNDLVDLVTKIISGIKGLFS